MFRRHFLSLSTGAGMLAMTGCSTVTNYNSAVDTVATDVGLIASAFQGIFPQIAVVHGITPDMVAVVQSAVTNLQTMAAQLRTVNNIGSAQPLVKQVEDDINMILAILAKLPAIPRSIAVVLQAANVILPVVENAVNIVVSPKLAARSAGAQMTTTQARDTLRSAQ